MTTQLETKRALIVAVASGKGGVGKTSLSLNISRALAKMGKRVLVFDADIGLANIDVQLGLAPGKDLSDVLQGKAMVKDVIAKTDKGFDVVPGRSGGEDLPFITGVERQQMLRQVQDVAENYDLILLDVAAGVSDEVLTFAKFADRTLLVVTPDPSSITDAYAVIKLLKLRHNVANCTALVNMATSETDGKNTYTKLKTAAEKFLQINLPLTGILVHDKAYTQAVRMQQLAIDTAAHLKLAEQLNIIAKAVLVR
jgi:flagellar biosynthesis protein FlhG